MIDAPSALIWTMVLVSAADSDMTDVEFRTIGGIDRQLPVFKNFDLDRVADDAVDVYSNRVASGTEQFGERRRTAGR